MTRRRDTGGGVPCSRCRPVGEDGKLSVQFRVPINWRSRWSRRRALCSWDLQWVERGAQEAAVGLYRRPRQYWDMARCHARPLLGFVIERGDRRVANRSRIIQYQLNAILVSMVLWERSGSVPALVDVVQPASRIVATSASPSDTRAPAGGPSRSVVRGGGRGALPWPTPALVPGAPRRLQQQLRTGHAYRRENPDWGVDVCGLPECGLNDHGGRWAWSDWAEEPSLCDATAWCAPAWRPQTDQAHGLCPTSSHGRGGWRTGSRALAPRMTSDGCSQRRSSSGRAGLFRSSSIHRRPRV